MSNNIHDMRQDYERRISALEIEKMELQAGKDNLTEMCIEEIRAHDACKAQLAAKDARIAALEKAILDTINLADVVKAFAFRDYIVARTEGLLSTHTAKSE